MNLDLDIQIDLAWRSYFCIPMQNIEVIGYVSNFGNNQLRIDIEPLFQNQSGQYIWGKYFFKTIPHLSNKPVTFDEPVKPDWKMHAVNWFLEKNFTIPGLIAEKNLPYYNLEELQIIDWSQRPHPTTFLKQCNLIDIAGMLRDLRTLGSEYQHSYKVPPPYLMDFRPFVDHISEFLDSEIVTNYVQHKAAVIADKIILSFHSLGDSGCFETNLLHSLVQSNTEFPPLEDSQIDEFRRLVKAFYWDWWRTRKNFDCLSTDYTPQGELARICQQANIPEEILPWKNVWHLETDDFFKIIQSEILGNKDLPNWLK